MGEEVKMSEYETNGNGNDEERVADWEFGLPTADDLTPLSQPLIPPELASAFSISPEPYRSLLEVNRETQNTLLNLRSVTGALSSNKFKSYNDDPMTAIDTAADEIIDNNNDNHNNNTDQEKLRRLDSGEEADSALRTENFTGGEDPATARTLKRPRLVWTPQLHKRFVDVVAYLGIKNAVPKTIMQLMNVEGLTRENVASHLQKYRLYLKRMQGLSNEAPSAADHQLFASTPVPQSLQDNSNGNGGEGNGHVVMPVPVPYHHHPGVGPMMTMPMYVGNNNSNNNNNHNHNHHNHNPYNMIQQRDWSGNHNYQPQHM